MGVRFLPGLQKKLSGYPSSRGIVLEDYRENEEDPTACHLTVVNGDSVLTVGDFKIHFTAPVTSLRVEDGTGTIRLQVNGLSQTRSKSRSTATATATNTTPPMWFKILMILAFAVLGGFGGIGLGRLMIYALSNG